MKAISWNSWELTPALGAILLFLSCQSPPATADSGVITVPPPKKLSVTRNAVATAAIRVELRSGYHVNSHQPGDDYLIPLRLTWDAGPLDVVEIEYPEPALERYPFSEEPLSVFTGDFKIRTRFHAGKNAPRGAGAISGKLRYQACTGKLCLPPRTVSVSLPVEVQ